MFDNNPGLAVCLNQIRSQLTGEITPFSAQVDQLFRMRNRIVQLALLHRGSHPFELVAEAKPGEDQDHHQKEKGCDDSIAAQSHRENSPKSS